MTKVKSPLFLKLTKLIVLVKRGIDFASMTLHDLFNVEVKNIFISE